MAGTMDASAHGRDKRALLDVAVESYRRLSQDAQLMIVEGAGSPAETNLRRNDIANMGLAQALGLPVVLVGDINRGHVIAALAGAHVVLDPADRDLIRGFIVNRFRGDPTLFADGMALIAARTGWSPFGLVPFFPDAGRLPPEDAVALDAPQARRDGAVPLIAVLRFPHIANFDDLDPLRQEPGVAVTFVPPGEPVPAEADLIILPGSKTTIDDLECLRAEGWDIDIRAHLRRGRHVLGLCGGYQMLGRSIADPQGIEGAPRDLPGLGLLDVETVMTGEKRLVAATGTTLADGAPFSGYEMHIGDTTGPDTARPLLRFADGRADGAVSGDGLVTGTYVHGLFADDRQRAAWLARLGAAPGLTRYEAGIEEVLDRFADHLEAHLDCDGLLRLR
jgi:adenosylcobyric acid synthase